MNSKPTITASADPPKVAKSAGSGLLDPLPEEKEQLSMRVPKADGVEASYADSFGDRSNNIKGPYNATFK